LGDAEHFSALVLSNKLDEILPKENRKQSPAEEWATIRSSFDIVLLAGDLASATSLQTILKSSSVDYIQVDL
jgi:predicted phosphohydrolase